MPKVNIRQRKTIADYLNISPEKEQAFYRKMKARYALPLPADEQEKQDLISEALKNGQSIADLI